MENKRFMEKETKVFSIITIVIMALFSLITLIVGIVSNKLFDTSYIAFSSSFYFFLIFLGAMEIKVFVDYKNQDKLLCTDGIFYICFSILTFIIGVVDIVMQAAETPTTSLKYIAGIFFIAFSCWKILLGILDIKKKYKTSIYEFIFALLLIVGGVGTILLASSEMAVTGRYMVLISLIAYQLAMFVFILLTYVLKDPDYLITEKGRILHEEALKRRAARFNRFNELAGEPTSTDTPSKDSIEEKLTKLQSLRDKNFITQEEYEKRKAKILDEEL